MNLVKTFVELLGLQDTEELSKALRRIKDLEERYKVLAQIADTQRVTIENLRAAAIEPVWIGFDPGREVRCQNTNLKKNSGIRCVVNNDK